MAELKQNYLCEIADRRNNETPAYSELAEADNLVTDEEIFDHYAGTEFTAEDFVCSGYNDLPWWEK